MLRPGESGDFAAILAVINAAAQRYRGVIPTDCWHDPYMRADALASELAAGVRFTVCEEAGRPVGVMGLQHVREVALIRHAYTLPDAQGRGVGSTLLASLCADTATPILIGTWAAASWAIRFYKHRGFSTVSAVTKDALLDRYWQVPVRQRETSVVLVDGRWMGRGGAT
ncbi:MAG: N-acetyltransferase family protein [Gammaproteobacteria bacterium]